MSRVAFGALVAFLTVPFAGCASSTDPCEGLSGTCVALTVSSSTISALDTLRFTASGAVTGVQSSMAPSGTALPIRVALRLPALAAGALHLDVEGVLSGNTVGSGSTDVTVAAGQHTSASVTLTGNGGGDGGTDGGGDGAVPDLGGPCDPEGAFAVRCGWKWVTPLPQGDDFIAVVAVSDTEMYAMTDTARVWQRGATGWSFAGGVDVAGFVPHAFTMASGAMVVAGSVPVTTDMGGTRRAAILRSANKGQTWTSEALPATPADVELRAIHYGGNPEAIAVGDAGTILYKDTGGAWATVTSGSATLNGVLALNNFGGILVGDGGNIARWGTGAGGVSFPPVWTPQTSGTTQNLKGICIPPNGFTPHLWAVGSGGTILKSIDTGASWTPQTSGVAFELAGCVSTDPMHVWAFGATGVVYTSNGGTTWTGQAPPLESGESITGLAHGPSVALELVGTSGQILRSLDTGNSYASERTGTPFYPKALFSPAPGVLYAVESGKVWVSTNRGATWAQPTTTATSLSDGFGTSATDVYLVGDGIYKGTANAAAPGGVTFTQYTFTTPPPAGTRFIQIAGTSATGLFATAGYQDMTTFLWTQLLYRSTDQGASWQSVTLPDYTDKTSYRPFGSLFARGGELWLGTQLKVLYTTNGTTFTAQPVTGAGAGSIVTQIRGAANGELAATTDYGYSLHNTTGTAAWTAASYIGVESQQQFDIAITATGSRIYSSGVFDLMVSKDHGVSWQPFSTGMSSPRAAGPMLAFGDDDVFIASNAGLLHLEKP